MSTYRGEAVLVLENAVEIVGDADLHWSAETWSGTFTPTGTAESWEGFGGQATLRLSDGRTGRVLVSSGAGTVGLAGDGPLLAR